MTKGTGPRKIPVVFYRTRAGREVVRDWLRSLDESALGTRGTVMAAKKSPAKSTAKTRKKRAPRSTAGLVTLDGFLGTEGKREEFEAVAIKEVLAWQIAEAMREGKLSRKRLAERMNTSRSQIGRLLDPRDGNVTLATLQRAAAVVGRKLRLELV